MTAKRTLSFILVLSMLAVGAAPLAAGISLGQVVYACGVVENVAGWPVEGVEVRAFGTGPFGRADNLNHLVAENDLTGVTNATGVVTLRLRDESYVVTVSDPLGPADPLRGGAAYAPTPNSHGAGNELVEDLCEIDGAKVDGIPLGLGGKLVIQAPGQGFLVAKVEDGVLAADAALAGADVAITPSLRDGPKDSFHVHTDDAGEARFACVSGASGAALALRVHMEGYVDSLAQAQCRAAKPAPVVPVTLWRTPVTLVATVTNQTDITDVTPAAMVEPKAGVAVPLEAAALALASQPAVFKALEPGSALCPDAPVDPSIALGTTGASPYLCAAATNAAGVAMLRVPWGGAYALAASHPLYQTQTQAVDLPAAEEPPAGANVRELRFTLVPPEFAVEGKIVDAHGANVTGAAVAFWNNVTAFETTTDGAGNFSLPVVAGPYYLNITADGYNPRQCFLDVDRAGNLANVTPAHCFQLIGTGMALVTGVAKDKETSLPLADLTLCATFDGGEDCEETHADGSYHLQIPAGTPATVNADEERWEFSSDAGFTPPLSIAALEADEVDPRGDALLARVKVPVTVVALGENGPLFDVDVDIFVGTVEGTKLTPSSGNKTDANGKYVFELRWTDHENDALDANEYVVKLRRHRAPDHYLDATQSFAIEMTSLSQTQTVTMELDGYVSTVVRVLDDHTQGPIQGVQVKASATGMPCDTAVCWANTSAAGNANVLMPASHKWKVCAEKLDYETGACVTNVQPGSEATISLTRTKVSLAITVLDPHTQLPVKGRSVVARGLAGFDCDPTTDGADCAGMSATSNTGLVTLSLPWWTAGQMCIVADAGNGDVVLQSASTQAATETGVGFQAASNCTAIPPSPASQAMALNALRANATPWTGALVAADGSPIAGARVVPTIERAGFVCAPSGHHSGDGASADCAGALVADGNYSLSLPMGTLPTHRWSVTGNATGHFNETWTTAQSGGAMAFRLWPTSFDALLTVEGADPADCNVDKEVGVYLYDLERFRPAMLTSEPAGATPAVPIDAQPALVDGEGKCVATLHIAEWNRNPQAQPLGAPAWSKEDNAYAFEVVYQDHVAYGALRLGPLAREATVTLTRVSTTTADYAAGIIRGSVTDADAAVLTGIPGAIVTATRAEGPCHGTAAAEFTAGTNAAGEYTLPVPCPGTYAVAVGHASDLYVASEPVTTVIAGDPLALIGGLDALPSATVDFPLARTRVSLTVTVQEIDREMRVEGASVDPVGVDTTADPAAVVTGADGVAAFASLPWGVYTVAIAPPATHDVLTPQFVLALVPGGPSEISALAFKR